MYYIQGDFCTKVGNLRDLRDDKKWIICQPPFSTAMSYIQMISARRWGIWHLRNLILDDDVIHANSFIHILYDEDEVRGHEMQQPLPTRRVMQIPLSMIQIPPGSRLSFPPKTTPVKNTQKRAKSPLKK